MAIKKRVSLREKSVRKTVPVKRAPVGVVKRKMVDRRAPSDPNEAGISKSAVRRRKRKLRQELAPKFATDMLSALTTSTGTVIEEKNGVESISVGKSSALDHTPKATNARGERALARMEGQQFKQILKAQPKLGDLRSAILMNMSNLKNK